MVGVTRYSNGLDHLYQSLPVCGIVFTRFVKEFNYEKEDFKNTKLPPKKVGIENYRYIYNEGPYSLGAP